ncbi:hypothetical protein [Rhizobium leguminosarum]|uniref:hypothetical protein n=1 Tax=Rhizobium leguminosarum TaxID=384 RepID=UPI0019824FA4|nr:hypothetical protein [Rhizobium leguminosarum]
MQIGEDNVHRIRATLDEVFGAENCCGLIALQKTTGAGSPGIGTDVLASVMDYVIWFAKDKTRAKYRQVYREKVLGEEGTTQYVHFRDRQNFKVCSGVQIWVRLNLDEVQ